MPLGGIIPGGGIPGGTIPMGAGIPTDGACDTGGCSPGGSSPGGHSAAASALACLDACSWATTTNKFFFNKILALAQKSVVLNNFTGQIL